MFKVDDDIKTVWIIGKGPSLQFLKKEDIGEGLVITLNEAILAVEPMNLPNLIYSLQKDGGKFKNCTDNKNCPERCGKMVRPKNATLILHDKESKYCYPNYPKRYVFSLADLNLGDNVFSFIFAIQLAKRMGIEKFNFVSFDAHTKEDFNVYLPGKGIIGKDKMYPGQKWLLRPYIKNIDCEWITPVN